MVVHKPNTMVVGLPGSLFSYIHIIYMYVYHLAYSYPADPLIHQFNNNLSIFIYTILGPSKKTGPSFSCSWENLFNTLSPRNTNPSSPFFWSGFWESWDPKPMRPNRTPGASPTYHLRKKSLSSAESEKKKWSPKLEIPQFSHGYPKWCFGKGGSF